MRPRDALLCGVAAACLLATGCASCDRCPPRIEYRTVEVPVPIPCPRPDVPPRPQLPELTPNTEPATVVTVLVTALERVTAWAEELETALSALPATSGSQR